MKNSLFQCLCACIRVSEVLANQQALNEEKPSRLFWAARFREGASASRSDFGFFHYVTREAHAIIPPLRICTHSLRSRWKVMNICEENQACSRLEKWKRLHIQSGRVFRKGKKINQESKSIIGPWDLRRLHHFRLMHSPHPWAGYKLLTRERRKWSRHSDWYLLLLKPRYLDAIYMPTVAAVTCSQKTNLDTSHLSLSEQ